MKPTFAFVRSYSRFILRLSALLGVLLGLMVLGCSVIGGQAAGNTISVFTTNTQETTDVWVMDVSRLEFVRLHVSGHNDDLPVWSAQERRVVYYPRNP